MSWRTHLPKLELKRRLTDLGLQEDDVLMVHASLRKLGPVIGGAHTVIESICEVIGERGIMSMILGSCEGDIFDARTSPSDPAMGVLAEQFRNYPGVEVNDHPAARFAALGARASSFLNPSPRNDYYGKGSVLERFVGSRGKILRLGANPDTTTVTHYAEYLANVSPKRRVTRRYITETEGEMFIDSLDDSMGIQDWPMGDYFARILLDYVASGKCARGSIGNCRAELIDAGNFVEFAVTWMEKNLEKSG